MSSAVQRTDRQTVVRLDGQLTLRDVPAVRGVLLKCLAECPPLVIVDLAGMTISGPMVLTVFPSVLRRTSDWPGVPLVLAGANRAVATALRLSGIAAEIPLVPTPEEASMSDGAHLRARLRLHLRPTVDAAGEARRMTADACAAWSIDHVGPAAAVVVTELVDNAVRHARTDLEVTIAYCGEYLHLSVADRSADPPRLRTEPVPVDQGGRGLRLVDTFASGWGVLPVPDGKSIWATLGTR